jgi:hypothetical protein
LTERRERVVDLDRLAAATAAFLVQGVLDSGLVASMVEAYSEVCRWEQGRFGIISRDVGEDQLKHLLFEVVCFATFIVMSQEAPRCILRGQEESEASHEAEDVRYFNQRLVDRVEQGVRRAGITDLREVIPVRITPDIEFGRGEPLDVVRRIRWYAMASGTRGAELFAQQVAYAVDPQRYAELTVIGMRHVRPLVELTRMVLAKVFSDTRSREGRQRDPAAALGCAPHGHGQRGPRATPARRAAPRRVEVGVGLSGRVACRRNRRAGRS